MVVILIHWLIQKDKEEEFKTRYEEMGKTLAGADGFLREILTKLDEEPQNSQFHTFSLGDPFYSTFINIGMWESVEAFRQRCWAIHSEASSNRRKRSTEIYDHVRGV